MDARAEPAQVALPEGTVDLRTEVVPAIRDLLRGGLSKDVQRACVRVGAFTEFGGGLKADLVGGLRIDVNAAIKLGNGELALHRALMESVNRIRPHTFPEVLSLVSLSRGRQLMFMERLMGHDTLLELVYERPSSRGDLERVLDKAIDGVRAVRRVARADRRMLRRLPSTSDPYSARLRDRIERVIAADPELAVIAERPGRAMDVPLPPIGRVLDDLSRYVPKALAGAPSVPCHGDLHLGNVMARKRGRGFSVRLIDPNPTIGVSDPLYDAGKLLHWAEPVGWARVAPDKCRGRLRARRDGWSLHGELCEVSAAAEARRAFLEGRIHERLARLGRPSDTTRAARLFVAIASAHVGLAALLDRPDQAHARRFALAYALAALGRWHSIAGS